MFKSNKCYNGGLKHNFQPRYTENRNDREFEVKNFSGDLRKLIYYNVYECDVCIWCGKVIKKD